MEAGLSMTAAVVLEVMLNCPRQQKGKEQHALGASFGVLADC